MLAGGATAICGASAPLAIAAVLPRDEKLQRDTLVVVVMAALLSTVAMLAAARADGRHHGMDRRLRARRCAEALGALGAGRQGFHDRFPWHKYLVCRYSSRPQCEPSRP